MKSLLKKFQVFTTLIKQPTYFNIIFPTAKEPKATIIYNEFIPPLPRVSKRDIVAMKLWVPQGISGDTRAGQKIWVPEGPRSITKSSKIFLIPACVCVCVCVCVFVCSQVSSCFLWNTRISMLQRRSLTLNCIACSSPLSLSLPPSPHTGMH